MKSSAKSAEKLTGVAKAGFKAGQAYVAKSKAERSEDADAKAAAPAATVSQRAERAIKKLAEGVPVERMTTRRARVPFMVTSERVPDSEEPEGRSSASGTFQTAVRFPNAMMGAIDAAVERSPIEFQNRADFIRRAVENELRKRGLVEEYAEKRGPKPKGSAFAHG